MINCMRVFFSLEKREHENWGILDVKQEFSLFLSWRLGYEERCLVYKEQSLAKRAEINMASTFKLTANMKAGKEKMVHLLTSQRAS